LELLETFRPPPGKLAVVRDEAPKTYGDVLILPDTWRDGTKMPQGVIHSAGPGVEDFEPGQRVLLAVGVAESIAFGDRDEQRIYLCYPEEVLGWLHEEGEVARSGPGERPYESKADKTAEEGVADTGRTTPRNAS
jgi:hypothetical protein